MADKSILREFLVKLGFDIDQAKLKKFTDSVETVTKRVALISVAVEGAALAVAAAVTKIAGEFDDLYFASQRLASSAQNISAFAFGFKQVGVESSSALTALEAFNSFLRSSPGARNYLSQSWNIPLTDANGRVRESTELFSDLTQKVQGLDFWAAKARLGVLGITDERLIYAMKNNSRDMATAVARMKEVDRSIGFDPEKGAKVGYEFTHQVNDLKMVVGELTKKIGLDIAEKLLPLLVKFDKWLTTPKAVQWIEDVLKWVVSLGLQILDAGIKIVNFFVQLDEATGHWSSKLLLLGVALKTSGILDLATSLIAIDPLIGGIVVAVGALAAAFVVLGGDYENWKKTSKSGLGIDWSMWTAQIEQVTSDFQKMWQALDAIVHSPLAQWINNTLIHGALDQLDRLLTSIGAKFKLIADLANRNWKEIPADMARITVADSATLSMKQIHEALGDRASGVDPSNQDNWTPAERAKANRAARAPGIRNPFADNVVGSTDPANQPRVLVGALSDLTQTIKQLMDQLNSGVGDALNPSNDNSTGSPEIGRIAPNASIKKVATLLINAGMTPTGAMAMAAAGYAESHLNPGIVNSIGAAGAWQLYNPAYKAAFRSMFHKRVQDSTIEEQSQFIAHLITTDPKFNRAINMAGSVGSGLKNALHMFENPGPAGERGDWHRAIAGLRASGQSMPKSDRSEAIVDYDTPASYHRSMMDRTPLVNTHLGGDRNHYDNSDHSKVVTLAPKTDIHVYGSDDPSSTGKAVYSEQYRLHGDLLRNAKTMVV